MTEEKKSKAVNIFAILGFALLVLVAIWSTVQVVKFVPRMFGEGQVKLPNISLGGDEDLKVELSKLNVESEEPIDIKWRFGKKDKGIMSFSYACESGFHFRLPSKEGENDSEYTILPCNAPYNIPSEDNSLTVIPVSDLNRYLDVAFAITYTNQKGESIRDVAQITVNNKKLSVSPSTISKLMDDKDAKKDGDEITYDEKAKDESKKQTDNNIEYTGSTKGLQTETTKTVTKKVVRYVTVPAGPYSNPYGTPDLKLKIISVGAIDPYTGAFVPKGTIKSNERAAIKFEVENTGDKASGAWTYSAELPTYPQYTYASKTQSSLMPGSRATVIVAFDKLTTGRVAVGINVDPYNAVPERNEYNNSDARYFSVY